MERTSSREDRVHEGREEALGTLVGESDALKKSLIEIHGKIQKPELTEASSKRSKWEQREVMV